MKSLLKATLLSLLVSALHATPVEVGDTGVTFDAPDDLKPLTKEAIAIKWPTTAAPAYAVGNERATTTVAYGINNNFIPQAELPEAQKAFTKLFDRMVPGIVWKKNEIIELSGQKWLLMEMSSSAVDTDIHNIMLATGFKGKLLIFNFNSTKEEFPKYEEALRKSLKSIKLPEPG